MYFKTKQFAIIGTLLSSCVLMGDAWSLEREEIAIQKLINSTAKKKESALHKMKVETQLDMGRAILALEESDTKCDGELKGKIVDSEAVQAKIKQYKDLAELQSEGFFGNQELVDNLTTFFENNPTLNKKLNLNSYLSLQEKLKAFLELEKTDKTFFQEVLIKGIYDSAIKKTKKQLENKLLHFGKDGILGNLRIAIQSPKSNLYNKKIAKKLGKCDEKEQVELLNKLSNMKKLKLLKKLAKSKEKEDKKVFLPSIGTHTFTTKDNSNKFTYAPNTKKGLKNFIKDASAFTKAEEKRNKGNK